MCQQPRHCHVPSAASHAPSLSSTLALPSPRRFATLRPWRAFILESLPQASYPHAVRRSTQATAQRWFISSWRRHPCCCSCKRARSRQCATVRCAALVSFNRRIRWSFVRGLDDSGNVTEGSAAATVGRSNTARSLSASRQTVLRPRDVTAEDEFLRQLASGNASSAEM